MTGYIGIGGKAKKVNNIYVGIGGKAKKVIKGYVGVGGKAKLWYSAQKLWTWEKHNIDTTTTYTEVVGSATSLNTTDAPYVGSSYSFNSSTGQFSVFQGTYIAPSNSGASKAVGKYYVSWATTSGTYSGTTVYKITAATYSSGKLRLTLQPTSSQSQTQQSMGSLIGTVTDADITAYPMDGPQDGYWYLFISELPTIDFSYTGTYVSSVVNMDGTPYQLLELSSSGVLALAESVSADIWVCGGGGPGKTAGGHGGCGAYANTVNNANIQNLTISIGAGGVYNASDYSNGTTGGQTSVSGDASLSANGGQGGNASSVSGGTGGGQGGADNAGTGDGLSKYPFNSNYFVYPYCDGGGGGGYYYSSGGRRGGDGGTNGGDGGSRSDVGNNPSQAIGGSGGHYGGNGGAGASSPPGSGENATGYGSGGGGGAIYGYSTATGGNGYQGVCFVRIPIA